MTERPLVYTVEQAAELLAIGRTAAYEACQRGELPALRIGRSLRIPRQALEQLLTAAGTDPRKTKNGQPGGHQVPG